MVHRRAARAAASMWTAQDLSIYPTSPKSKESLGANEPSMEPRAARVLSNGTIGLVSSDD
jgi:hypothetical protein